SQLTESVEVQAFGIIQVGTVAGVVNPLLFVTTTPCNQFGYALINPADALSARLDPSVVAGGNRWMFGWPIPPASPPAGVTMINPVEGLLALSTGSPPFEVSNTEHVWLYPQRANLVANPSFEKDTAFWACNGAIAQVAGAAPDDPPHNATMDDNFM